MRDLRSHGWRIDTNRDDTQLHPSELRLVYVGPMPSEPGFRTISTARISSKERVSAISSAGFRCRVCGIQLGEPDESESGFAHLRVTRTPDGLLVTCALCAKGGPGQARLDAELLRERLSRLSLDELQEFRARVRDGRLSTPLESAVALVSRIPPDSAITYADELLRNLSE
jgi:hypothetical protein